MTSGIPAVLVLDPDTAIERSIPVYDYLVVGRECRGVADDRRVLVDDPLVSRSHLELRLDPERDQAWLIDRSTNGTRLNGRRVERHTPVPIRPGDRVRLGASQAQFRSRRFGTALDPGAPTTLREIAVTDMVSVVGDIIAFSTISEYSDDRLVLATVDRLFGELRGVLTGYGGTLSNYVGDAFFATWDTAAADDATEAAERAVAFAVEAAELVTRTAPALELHDPAGGPLRMGWGVASGSAAVSTLTGMLVSVLGDATNVAFRLSGLAGRDDRPDVLVTAAVHDATRHLFTFGPVCAVTVKGRRQPVEVLGVGRL